jgi:hypothetical protein
MGSFRKIFSTGAAGALHGVIPPIFLPALLRATATGLHGVIPQVFSPRPPRHCMGFLGFRPLVARVVAHDRARFRHSPEGTLEPRCPAHARFLFLGEVREYLANRSVFHMLLVAAHVKNASHPHPVDFATASRDRACMARASAIASAAGRP